MNTPIVILNYKTYLESSGENALELARALKSASEESGITMVAAPQAADIIGFRIKFLYLFLHSTLIQLLLEDIQVLI